MTEDTPKQCDPGRAHKQARGDDRRRHLVGEILDGPVLAHDWWAAKYL